MIIVTDDIKKRGSNNTVPRCLDLPQLLPHLPHFLPHFIIKMYQILSRYNMLQTGGKFSKYAFSWLYNWLFLRYDLTIYLKSFSFRITRSISS